MERAFMRDAGGGGGLEDTNSAGHRSEAHGARNRPMTPREEIREAVVSFARRMHEDGLVSGTAGNVSARVPGEERIAITPSGFPYEEMEPDDVLVLDPGGAVVHGNLPPSVEWRVHLAVYRARPDVGAIIHT